MTYNQLLDFNNKLQNAEKKIDGGELVQAFEDIDRIRLQVETEINKTFVNSGKVSSLSKHHEIIDKCDALKRKLLKEMAREL